MRGRWAPAIVVSVLVLVLSPMPSLGLQTAAPRGRVAVAVDPLVLPGDLVRLEVWREEELTGDFLVDQHHTVTLPMAGELDVRGETELSLRRRVRAALGEQLHNPSIQLFVLKRVRVLGEVLEPGLFELNATMSVADALAMAGGRTPLALEGEVELRREGTTVRTDVTEATLLAELEVRTGDELLVPQRSWIDRNLAPVVTGVTGVLGIVVALIVR